MSVIRTNDDGLDDMLDAMFGASSSMVSSSKSGVFAKPTTAAPTLGLSGPSKHTKEDPKASQYVSKGDQLEEGRMSSKVIRTQLVKQEKAETTQRKFEQAEKIRLQALIGKQAQDKIKRKRNQLDSSDDEDIDAQPTSKLGLVQAMERERVAKEMEKQQLLKKNNNNNQPTNTKIKNDDKNIPSPNSTTNITDDGDDNNDHTTDVTETATKKKKKKNKKQRVQPVNNNDDDEVVMLEAD